MLGEKMISLIKNWMTIYGFIAALFVAGAVIADTKFQTDDEALASEIRTLIRVQKDLQVQLGYAENDRKKEELISRIKLIQLEIDELRSDQ